MDDPLTFVVVERTKIGLATLALFGRFLPESFPVLSRWRLGYMLMLEGLSNLITEHFLPKLVCLELGTHIGTISCFIWLQIDPSLESSRPSGLSGQWMGGETLLMGEFYSSDKKFAFLTYGK